MFERFKCEENEEKTLKHPNSYCRRLYQSIHGRTLWMHLNIYPVVYVQIIHHLRIGHKVMMAKVKIVLHLMSMCRVMYSFLGLFEFPENIHFKFSIIPQNRLVRTINYPFCLSYMVVYMLDYRVTINISIKK